MTIQEILRQHQISDDLNCECGYNYDQHNPNEETFEVIYTAHQAEVLNKHMQEREAAVIAGLAELLDEYQNSHDIAECAAPVEGETGRQAVIDNWESITEEPAEWLRQKSKEHHENGFEYLLYVAYEAWQAGYESGCEDMENGGHATINPYADEEPTDGR